MKKDKNLNKKEYCMVLLRTLLRFSFGSMVFWVGIILVIFTWLIPVIPDTVYFGSIPIITANSGIILIILGALASILGY